MEDPYPGMGSLGIFALGHPGACHTRQTDMTDRKERR